MTKLLVIKGADFSEVAVGKVDIDTGKIAISVVASPFGGGTTTGSGCYEIGTQVTISAEASSGYKFVRWSDGDTSANRVIIVGDSAETYTAVFEIGGELKFTQYDGWCQGYYGKELEGYARIASTDIAKLKVAPIPNEATKIRCVGNSVKKSNVYFIKSVPQSQDDIQKMEFCDMSDLITYIETFKYLNIPLSQDITWQIPSDAVAIGYNEIFTDGTTDYSPQLIEAVE